MSDKDVLISMGFDPARIECMSNSSSNDVRLSHNPGALRATNGKGLQPAMDFILEHNDDPIPDATSGAPATSSVQPHNEPIGEDEDEDAAALRAVYGLQPGGGSGSQTDHGADVEAQVSRLAWHLFTRRS